MKCPFCSYTESKVVDSRPAEDSEKIRRRRECLSCGKRFTTYEVIENTPLIVVKKDHSRQIFDRDKLLRLFFAMGLELPQAQRGLELYGLAALYPRKKRDAILIIAFNRGISWVDQVDDLLIQHGEPPLSRCRD